MLAAISDVGIIRFILMTNLYVLSIYGVSTIRSI